MSVCLGYKGIFVIYFYNLIIYSVIIKYNYPPSESLGYRPVNVVKGKYGSADLTVSQK